MNGFDYLITKQIAWINKNNINVKLVGKKELPYTNTFNENLFVPLNSETKTEIEKGAGGELKDNTNYPAKMRAVHSSSAIGVNVFQYWRNKNIPDIAYSLRLCRKENKTSQEIKFEQKFIISDKFNYSPNIDIVIYNEKTARIKAYGIECKFSEAYRGKPSGLKEKYINSIPEQWKNIPNLFEFANTISPNNNSYRYLHSAQLIKHILGLKKIYGKGGFRLLYLWCDVTGDAGCKHRKEINEFAEIAKLDNIKFHSISYQELIFNLNRNFYKENEKYIDYLTDRYL